MAIPTALNAIDTAAWVVQDARSNPNGGKTAAIRDSVGPPLVALTTPDAPLRCPFQPSAYTDPAATRLHIFFRLDETAKAGLETVDAWCMDYVTRPEHLERFFPMKSKE